MSKLSALVSLALFFSSCSAVALQPSPVEAREATPVARAVEPSASAGGLQQKLYAKGKLYFGTCADPGTLNNNGELGALIFLELVVDKILSSQREHHQEGLRAAHPRELDEGKARCTVLPNNESNPSHSGTLLNLAEETSTSVTLILSSTGRRVTESSSVAIPSVHSIIELPFFHTNASAYSLALPASGMGQQYQR